MERVCAGSLQLYFEDYKYNTWEYRVNGYEDKETGLSTMSSEEESVLRKFFDTTEHGYIKVYKPLSELLDDYKEYHLED